MDEPSAIGNLDADTALSRGTFMAALAGAGACCHAIDSIMQGSVSAPRLPPGLTTLTMFLPVTYACHSDSCVGFQFLLPKCIVGQRCKSSRCSEVVGQALVVSDRLPRCTFVNVPVACFPGQSPQLLLQARNAFCAIRPPGHHAGPLGTVTSPLDPHGSQGFCFFNNIAIAAAYAVNVYRHQGQSMNCCGHSLHSNLLTVALHAWVAGILCVSAQIPRLLLCPVPACHPQFKSGSHSLQ